MPIMPASDKQINNTKQTMNNQLTHNAYNQPHQPFLTIPTKIPARLDAAQVARLLGFAEHDIPVLVSAKILKPLGNPISSSVKHFATCIIEDLGQNPKWLSEATQATYEHWKSKNAKKKVNAVSCPETA